MAVKEENRTTAQGIFSVILSFLVYVINGGIFYSNGFFYSEFVTHLYAGTVILSSLAAIQTSLCLTTGMRDYF